MEAQYDVILTNPGGETGEIVAADLEAHGLKVYVLKGPNASKIPHAFLKAVKDTLESTGARTVIPIFFPQVLAAHKEDFPDVLIPVDTVEKISLLDDKISCCALARSLGIRQPVMWDSPQRIPDGAFPVVFKRPCGQGGDSVYFPKTRKSLENLLTTASKYIISEYIDGYDICLDCLRWGKDFFFSGAYKVLEMKGMKGVSTKRESILAPELSALAEKILDSIDYQGVCGFDFRISNSTGEAYFLECNPRFCGGLSSALSAGFDLPWLYYSLATGRPAPSPESIAFSPGVITGISASL